LALVPILKLLDASEGFDNDDDADGATVILDIAPEGKKDADLRGAGLFGDWLWKPASDARPGDVPAFRWVEEAAGSGIMWMLSRPTDGSGMEVLKIRL
jgi:hypothetical protein